MRKREFNALLKRITTKKRIDIEKISDLTEKERSDMVHYIVRNRLPVIKELIPEDFDMAWLHCMGYLDITMGKQSGYTFVHKAEYSII